MLGVMGVGLSTLSSARMFLIGMDEDYMLQEFDDIKMRLRKCENDYNEFQTQEFVIPSKLNTLKNHIEYTNKMYEMVNILEREWCNITRRMKEYRRQMYQ